MATKLTSLQFLVFSGWSVGVIYEVSMRLIGWGADMEHSSSTTFIHWFYSCTYILLCATIHGCGCVNWTSQRDPRSGCHAPTNCRPFHHSIISRLSQDGRRFAWDIFKILFLYENCCALVKISLKLVPNAPIYKKTSLIQMMVWRRLGDNSSYEPMMA